MSISAKRVYSEKDKARVLLTLQINDGNVKRTSRQTEVPEQTVRTWKKQWEEEGVPEVIEDIALAEAGSFAARAEKVRDLALDEWEKQVLKGEVKARDLMIGIGVLTDKIDRARGLARSQPQDGPKELPSREEMMALAQGITRGAIEAVQQRDQEIVDAEVVEQATEALPPGQPTKE